MYGAHKNSASSGLAEVVNTFICKFATTTTTTTTTTASAAAIASAE